MEKYNYAAAVLNDVEQYINGNYTPEKIVESLEDRDSFADQLYEDMWANDSVTGNGSGSYTFNSWEASEYLVGNWGLMQEALEEFGYKDVPVKDLDAERMDVTIRCYCLTGAISSALDKLEEEYADQLGNADDEGEEEPEEM